MKSNIPTNNDFGKGLDNFHELLKKINNHDDSYLNNDIIAGVVPPGAEFINFNTAPDIVKDDIVSQYITRFYCEIIEKYRGIVEQSTLGFVLTDESGKIIVWNNALEYETGLSKENTISEPIWDLLELYLTAENIEKANSISTQDLVTKILKNGDASELKDYSFVFLNSEFQSPIDFQDVYTIKTISGFRLCLILKLDS